MSQILPVLYIGGSAADGQFISYLLKSYHNECYEVTSLQSVNDVDKYCEKAQPICILLDGLPADPAIEGWILQLRNLPATKNTPLILLSPEENSLLIMPLIDIGLTANLIKTTVSAESLHLAIHDAIQKAGYNRQLTKRVRGLADLPNREQFDEIFAFAISHARQRQRSCVNVG
jgi:PleD family two-component response regulator